MATELQCPDSMPCHNRTASRGDFMFSADRLIRLVVEEGLNQLPYKECTVTTPTGHKYEGVKFEKGNCGVSIMRSGEAMEQGLRDCCRSIRIGKILIQSDEETQRAKVYYAKFPPDIYRRKVLLMYPILSTGNTVIEAVKVLIEHGVQPSVIILLSLFSTPHGAKSIIQEFPEITILTTEVHPVAPTHFGQKYFGTD
ncbi:uracil phosphoribosyltransferase homolog isoform X2 [Peromyscus californicus insignis]|uniref:uracil phosphoribosyltransferase homolog isoform X2 n=1 Tax=Peromyscus californicus insignis TaxID=564181 RepID=UPI0022A71111|nr:uracil phosphoribosyltransferase homolog isoform X2 [Peromyscus californicus insignis]